MSDHTTLTDTERATLAAWWESDWPSDGADVLDTLAAVVESIVAARVAAARAERDRAWIGAVTLLLRAVTTNDATLDAVLPDMLAQARAARDAEWQRHLNALPDEMAEAWGGDATWLTTGNKVATLVGDWLADMHYDLTPADQEVDHG